MSGRLNCVREKSKEKDTMTQEGSGGSATQASDRGNQDMTRQFMDMMNRFVDGMLAMNGNGERLTGGRQDERPVIDASKNLEEFSGKGDLLGDEWVRRFEVAKEIGQWSEAQIKGVLLAKMAGAARLWHLNHGIKCFTYAEWKTLFLAAFSCKMKMGVLMDQLQNCVQGRQEPLDD